MTRIHPTVAFLLVGALTFAGLALPGIAGALILLVLAGLLVAMMKKAVPVRLVFVGALVLVALVKLMRF